MRIFRIKRQRIEDIQLPVDSEGSDAEYEDDSDQDGPQIRERHAHCELPGERLLGHGQSFISNDDDNDDCHGGLSSGRPRINYEAPCLIQVHEDDVCRSFYRPWTGPYVVPLTLPKVIDPPMASKAPTAAPKESPRGTPKTMGETDPLENACMVAGEAQRTAEESVSVHESIDHDAMDHAETPPIQKKSTKRGRPPTKSRQVVTTSKKQRKVYAGRGLNLDTLISKTKTGETGASASATRLVSAPLVSTMTRSKRK